MSKVLVNKENLKILMVSLSAYVLPASVKSVWCGKKTCSGCVCKCSERLSDFLQVEEIKETITDVRRFEHLPNVFKFHLIPHGFVNGYSKFEIVERVNEILKSFGWLVNTGINGNCRFYKIDFSLNVWNVTDSTKDFLTWDCPRLTVSELMTLSVKPKEEKSKPKPPNWIHRTILIRGGKERCWSVGRLTYINKICFGVEGGFICSGIAEHTKSNVHAIGRKEELKIYLTPKDMEQFDCSDIPGDYYNPKN